MDDGIDMSNYGSITITGCRFEGTKESRNRFEWLIQNRDILMFCLRHRLPLPRYRVRSSDKTRDSAPNANEVRK